MINNRFVITIIILIIITTITNCGKKKENNNNNKSKYSIFEKEKITIDKNIWNKTTDNLAKNIDIVSTNNKELDFEIENQTGKAIYITCFSYIQKEPTTRWHWDKSAIYKIEDKNNIIVNIDTIPDKDNRENTFGYLAIFENELEAHESIYELTPDKNKIDIDKIYSLSNKKVVITIEKYGIKKEKLDFKIEDKFKKKTIPPELDFIVQNNTGKIIFITGFIYQVEDNIRSVWNYDKTPVQKLKPGQQILIDVDTIKKHRDRKYMLGFLGVFEEHEEQQAHNSTYELLDGKNKITLGSISKLKNKKVIIEVEQYGSIGSITEFDIKKV